MAGLGYSSILDVGTDWERERKGRETETTGREDREQTPIRRESGSQTSLPGLLPAEPEITPIGLQIHTSYHWNWDVFFNLCMKLGALLDNMSRRV